MSSAKSRLDEIENRVVKHKWKPRFRWIKVHDEDPINLRMIRFELECRRQSVLTERLLRWMVREAVSEAKLFDCAPV